MGVANDDFQRGKPALEIYKSLLARLQANIRRLTTVQFDPETGLQRHFFNGKLERVVQVRLLK